MSGLVRAVYISEITPKGLSEFSNIFSHSVARNSERGITGVLFQFGEKFVQVLEGEREQVQSLLEKIKRDTRHRNMRMYFFKDVETRFFSEWTMGQPLLLDAEARLLVKLLTSDNLESHQLSLMHLKYRLVSQWDGNGYTSAAAALKPLSAEEVSTKEERNRRLTIFAMAAAIFLAVLADIVYFAKDYLTAQTEVSLKMLQVQTFIAAGMLLAARAAQIGDIVQGVRLLQATAFTSISLHCLYVGYGLQAPSLPFLALSVVASVIGDKGLARTAGFTFATLALTVLLAVLTFIESTSAYVSQPVPLHHILVNLFSLPIVCTFLVYSSRDNQANHERFTARLLADLAQKVEALKLAMTARNHFFAAISHEIRTPMTGAMSAVNILSHPKADEAVKSRSVEALRYSLSSLNRLLTDLLDMSKLESNQFVLVKEPFDIRQATQSVLAFFQASIEEAKSELAVNLPDAESWVVGDRERYQQMLSNLISNAVKFTRGGTVSVSLSSSKPQGDHGSSLWRCEVKDTGPGVSPQDIGKLFQPFSQGNQHGFSTTKGTGLGLAIVAGLARQMGGTAGVESVEGQGATFWFTVKLPSQND